MESVVEPKDVDELRRLIENHRRYTESDVAARILDDWETPVPKFTKVMPIDYKRALEQLAKEQPAGDRPTTSPLPEAEPTARSRRIAGRPAVTDVSGMPT